MAIMLASDIPSNPPPQCPICGFNVTAFVDEHPFAVDASGRVYCERHGAQADPTYPQRFAEYQADLRVRVLKYLNEGPGGPLTEEELRAVDAELDG